MAAKSVEWNSVQQGFPGPEGGHEERRGHSATRRRGDGG